MTLVLVLVSPQPDYLRPASEIVTLNSINYFPFCESSVHQSVASILCRQNTQLEGEKILILYYYSLILLSYYSQAAGEVSFYSS
tara:strand:- start:99 stop:350 length:252 start_codon:yes stop_codon:yes gene_type:complete